MMHKNNRFSNLNTVGKTKGKNYYEFGTGYPETIGKNDKLPKSDQGLLQPDQNLNNIQTGDKEDI